MTVEDKLLIANLAQTADIINTINGGMSQASLEVAKNEDEWTVRIKVPGVSAERMKIEVKDSRMFIFQILPDTNAAEIELPYLLTAFSISTRVDYDRIVAEYENGEVFIHMPLDEMGDNQEREIVIIRK